MKGKIEELVNNIFRREITVNQYETSKTVDGDIIYEFIFRSDSDIEYLHITYYKSLSFNANIDSIVKTLASYILYTETEEEYHD